METMIQPNRRAIRIHAGETPVQMRRRELLAANENPASLASKIRDQRDKADPEREDPTSPTRQAVSGVIHGSLRSRQIALEIVALLGVSMAEFFPEYKGA